jgi:hypothetical protein
MSISISVNVSQGFADSADCDKLDKAVQTQKNFPSQENARDTICLLCQAGGTNNAQGNLSVTFVDTAAATPVPIVLTLKEIKDIMKANGIKMTLRQYARTRSAECHDVGEKFNVPGDLYKKLTMLHGTISREDSFWCSSFQMNTGNCPPHINAMLVDHYNKQFKKLP